jgi:hypothetical protein
MCPSDDVLAGTQIRRAERGYPADGHHPDADQPRPKSDRSRTGRLREGRLMPLESPRHTQIARSLHDSTTHR